jgi:ACS family glucarate transporter-like MFS transporter
VLSIAATDISRDLHLNTLRLGYLFSAFSWAYAAQLAAGSLPDRFGSKRVYGISIVCWSCCAFLSGFGGYGPAAVAFCILLASGLLSGQAQSPGFPANGRIVAALFPAAERGRASAIFNSSQYFSLVIFAPLMGWDSPHSRLEAGASGLPA